MTDATIKELETKLRQAMLESDVATLDELIADDLIFTLYTGQVFDKQADLTAYRTGLQTVTKVELGEYQMCHYDNFSVVTVEAVLAGTYHGEAYAGTYRYIRVWAKMQERWQIVAGNVSQVALR